jgi:hypothetical protein
MKVRAASYSSAGGCQSRQAIPVDRYESVRKFYEKIRAAEQSPVVLAKK